MNWPLFAVNNGQTAITIERQLLIPGREHLDLKHVGPFIEPILVPATPFP